MAGGAQFDVLLRLFASPAGISDEERCCEVKYVDGVLSLLLPVLGQLTISKLRADGDILGVPKSLKQGDRAFLQLGGPPQRYIATSSTAALLEVVLRHSTQETTLSSSLPELTSDEASDGFASLVGVFQDKDAKAHDAPPVPPAPSSTADDSAVGIGMTPPGSPLAASLCVRALPCHCVVMLCPVLRRGGCRWPCLGG